MNSKLHDRDTDLRRRPGIAARALGRVVRLYQALPRWRPPTCRFEPSCSRYALEALSVWGAGRGSWMSMRRVARCHPWGGWGYDPVPSRVDAAVSADHDCVERPCSM